MASILIGEKKSPIKSTLVDFESITRKQLASVVHQTQIPVGFVFLAGVMKYRNRVSCPLRFGSEYLFVQSMAPYHSENGIYRTRGFGNIYALYEPAEKNSDDVVLAESAVYQLLPANQIIMLLGQGEHLQSKCVGEMFAYIREQRNLQDFAPEGSLPQLYEVTFKVKSCGYFLHNRTYHVWATPVGTPDEQTGEIVKRWLFCDINCGIPAIIEATREEFVHIPVENGRKVGLFTYREGNLVFEE